MRLFKAVTNLVIPTFLLILLSSVSGHAQEIVVDYKFLETTVVDPKNRPVEGAVVETVGHPREAQETLRTDRDGRLPKGLPVATGHVNTIGFKVSKPGYFSYEDLGTIRGPFDSALPRSIKLELIPVTKTPGETADLDAEQRKREFLLACKKGDSATVGKFLQTGLDPNLTTSDLRGIPGPKNVPAIIWAAMSSDGETVTTLLAAGADVRNKGSAASKALIIYLQGDYWGHLSGTESPGQIATARRNYDKGVRSLIDAGADTGALSVDESRTTLMLCATRCTVETIKRLLEKNVPVNAKDKNGSTALRDAITSRDLAIVNLLLEAGANSSEILYDSEYVCSTPLIHAVEVDSLTILRTLINHKADINLACRNGETVLTHSVRSGHVPAVKMLLELGADVKGKQGERAMAITKLRPSSEGWAQEIIDLLVAAGAPTND
jgi:ankyrin repeat protein